MPEITLPEGRVLESLSAFEIVRLLQVGYTGDANPIDHGGCFYKTADWSEHGYAAAIRMYRVPDDENRLYVESCTINCIDLEGALHCFGWERCGEKSVRQVGSGDEIELTPEIEIEACLAFTGAEPVEDFNGPLLRKFRPNRHGFLREFKVWDAIRGWLEELAND